MTVLQHNPFLIASGNPTDPTFPLQRSVRLRGSAAAYFSRTFGTPTSATKYTFSAWVKRGTTGSVQQNILSACTGSSADAYIGFTNDLFFIGSYQGAGTDYGAKTNALFRDPTAWYHVVFSVDTTQAVAANRAIIYVNGIQQTTVNSASGYWPQNYTSLFNTATLHRIGQRPTFNDGQFDGYLTEVNFIDGQALKPIAFGGYNPGTGAWEPRKYSGAYGTNGFYLPFTNNASLEALGYDLADSSPELITNGMFVTNVTGWTVTPGTGGSPSITWQSAHTARLANINAFGATYYQAIPTVIGQTYYAQCYTSNISLGGATRNAQLLKGDNTNFSTNLVVLGSVPQSSGSGAIRNTFVATATTTYIGIQADVGGTSGSADFTQVSVSLNGYKDSWNPFNISLTAGATYDSMLDVPTLTSATNSSYCVLNPLSTNVTGIVPQQGNLYLGSSVTYNYSIVGTIGVSSGKWYWECRTDSGFSMVGITSLSSLPLQIAPHQSGSLAKIIYAAAANKYDNGTSSAYGATWTSADLIGIALDMDAGTLTFYKNGTSLGVAFTGLTGVYYPVFGGPNSYNHGWINFGQRPFEQTVPTGHKSLNLFNISDPAIKQPVSVHNLYTYTGNGGGLQVGEIQKPMSLFNLDRSIRIRAAQNAYFSRLPTVNGNGQKFTISTWIKRGKLGTGWTDTIFTGRTGTNFPELDIMFATDLIKLQAYTTGAALLMNVDTVNLYRDTNMWYHVVTAFDTTQAVAADRVKVYVNGVAQTIAAGATYPSQNLVLNANQTVTQYIGSSPANTAWGDLYFADYYMIDGQQLTPDSFGQYDGNYYWTPKAYTGTYGTNGFHLEFEDFSNNTATTIGKDTSGNGNNFTPTGINLTAPANTNASWDSMVDVPTQTSADVGNFATLSPLVKGANIAVSNGNLTWANATADASVLATLGVASGKWYWENTCTNTNAIVGIGTDAMTLTSSVGTTATGWGYRASEGNKFNNNSGTAYGASYTTGDVIGIAFDADAGKLWFSKNSVWQASGDPAAGTNAAFTAIPTNTYYPAFGNLNGGGNVNFGQRPFRYTPPTGFKSLNSFNIAEVIGDVETPDLVWIKSRSAATDHALFNSISGVGKYVRSSNSGLEVTDVNSLIQFNKNGFLLGNSAIVNTLSATYVAAAWKMAATTVTNNGGTIPSQVRANPTAGISIVRYTGNGTGALASVGHGLLLPPEVIIVKNLSANTNWPVYHIGMGNPLYYMTLNGTAIRLSDNNYWGATLPDYLQFYILGTTGSYTNVSGNNYEAICMRSIEGFSKFGSYNSNNATDGPFVYTGFRPRWLMVKRANAIAGATGGWFMYDAARNTYNVMDKYLFAEGTAGDGTLAVFDFTANGFKIRSNNQHVNTTAGDTYVYLAFAENPFKYALAR